MVRALRTFLAGCLWLPAARGDVPACTEEGSCRGQALLQHRLPHQKPALVQVVEEEQNEQGGQRAGAGSSAGGRPWTEDEALIVMTKLHKFLQDPAYWAERSGARENFECYAESEESNWTKLSVVPCDHYDEKGSHRTWMPGFPMMLRLGFHQCMKYKDGSGGCDGCLNFKNMFMTWGIKEVARFEKSRPTGAAGVNANLAMLGDVLEKIYTDKDFPEWAPKLERSLQETGKSRADLWAFAALVGAQQGMRKNNEDCDAGEALYSVMDVGVPCKIALSRPLTFYTGRKDCPEAQKPAPWRCDASCSADGETFTDRKCKSKKKSWPAVCKTEACRGCSYCMARDGSHKPRVYESLLEEDHPDVNFNGSRVADYFHRTFGMSKRETIALMGAHSYGKVRVESAGGFRYDWTHKQTDQLNNVYYRVISMMPGKHFEKGNRWGTDIPASVAPNVGGSMSPTRMFLHVDGKEAGGGIFQWFHMYLRCPYCYQGVNLDRHQKIWGTPKDRCCELCAKATHAEVTQEKPKYGYKKIRGLTTAERKEFKEHQCLRWVKVHETEFTSDVALHRAINVAEGGYPLDKNMKKFSIMRDDDPLNELRDPGDLPMHAIVEQYAKDQNLWADEFVAAVEKMLANGVETKLTKSFELGLDLACDLPAKRSQWMGLCGRA